MWWCTPIFPALRRLRQEDYEFKANLDSRASSRLVWAEKKIFK
jgi:hypothetical protein